MKAVERAEETDAAIVGESWWDPWHKTDRYVIHRGRSSLFAAWESGDTAHSSYEWARGHHEPHFGLVQGAAVMHDELMRAFRAEAGPLDHRKAVEALA